MQTRTIQHWLYQLTFFFERFGYYGMRAIVVLYMFDAISDDGIGLSRLDAIETYGYFTVATYFALVPAGLITDFVTKYRLGGWIGGAIAIIGYLLILGGNYMFLLLGLGFITLGIAFLRVSLFGLISDYLDVRDKRYSSIFIANYWFINLGAFIGIAFTAWLAEMYSYQASFLMAAFSVIIGYVVFIIASNLKISEPPRIPISNAKEVVDIGNNEILDDFSKNTILPNRKRNIIHYLILLFLAISVGVFWTSQEVIFGGMFRVFESEFPPQIGSLIIQQPWLNAINSIIIILGCLGAFVWVYLKGLKSNSQVIGLAAVLAAIGGLIAWATFSNISPNHSGKLILFLVFLLGLAELLLAPFAMAFVGRLSPPKFRATCFALYLFLVGMIGKVYNSINDWIYTIGGHDPFDGLIWLFIGALVIIGLLFFLISMLFKKPLNGIE